MARVLGLAYPALWWLIVLPLALLGALAWLLFEELRALRRGQRMIDELSHWHWRPVRLFLLFLVLVFLDILMSGIALRYGGREVGVLFWLVGDFQVMTFIKGVGSFLLGMVLVAYNQVGLLKLANVFMLALVAYHGVMLWQTFSP